MGIRFTTNTWRAPLQLIDSWLPLVPSTRHHGACRLLPQAVQRFARAGWLGRTTESTTVAAGCPVTVHPHPGAVVRGGTRTVRVLQAAAASHGMRQDARLVISGRINDVCAELDRLAALEQQHGRAAA